MALGDNSAVPARTVSPMFSSPASRPRRLLRACLASLSLLLLAPLHLHAQALPDSVHFGMTLEELQQATGPLERLPGARRSAAGAGGSWRGPDARLAGLAFEQTFVFARGRLSRIERVASTQALPDGGAAAFEQLVAAGRQAYGAETRTRDPAGDYAIWSLPGQDVYVQRTVGPASIRMVLTARQQRDDSAL